MINKISVLKFLFLNFVITSCDAEIKSPEFRFVAWLERIYKAEAPAPYNVSELIIQTSEDEKVEIMEVRFANTTANIPSLYFEDVKYISESEIFVSDKSESLKELEILFEYGVPEKVHTVDVPNCNSPCYTEVRGVFKIKIDTSLEVEVVKQSKEELLDKLR